MTAHQDQQKERSALVGSNSGMTYCRQAQIDNALESGGGGRFHNPPTVVGSEPFVRYPASSGPWNDPTKIPDEEPLGWSVEDQPPCGTPTEVQASLDALEIAASGSPFGGGDGDGELKPVEWASAGGDSNSVRLPSELPSGSPSPTKSNPSTSLGIKRRKGL